MLYQVLCSLHSKVMSPSKIMLSQSLLTTKDKNLKVYNDV